VLHRSMFQRSGKADAADMTLYTTRRMPSRPIDIQKLQGIYHTHDAKGNEDKVVDGNMALCVCVSAASLYHIAFDGTGLEPRIW
jgi:hypothetical protein